MINSKTKHFLFIFFREGKKHIFLLLNTNSSIRKFITKLVPDKGGSILPINCLLPIILYNASEVVQLHGFFRFGNKKPTVYLILKKYRIYLQKNQHLCMIISSSTNRYICFDFTVNSAQLSHREVVNRNSNLSSTNCIWTVISKQSNGYSQRTSQNSSLHMHSEVRIKTI